MINIFKNSWMIFRRNKEYISRIVVTPVITLLVFSFILSFQSKINIGVVDDDNDKIGSMVRTTLEKTDLFNIISMDFHEVNKSIIHNKIEFAVVVKSGIEEIDETKEKPIVIIKEKNSTLADYMEVILNSNMNSISTNRNSNFEILKNEVPKKGVPINNTLGMVIFKMLGSGSLLIGLLILEKKNGILDRIYMSKTKISRYLLGRGSAFLMNLLLFIFVYLITAKIFKFDFAMKNPLNIIFVFIVLGIFTVAFSMLLAAFINDESYAWNFFVLFLLPSSIVSGALFPYDSMPETMQKIGAFFPQRWITSAIEILQRGGNILDARVPLARVLIISFFLIIISIRRMKRTKTT